MQFVSEYSRLVLTDIMRKAVVPSILITSTARTPADQARIMYENIERYGVEHQKLLYSKYGDQVIDEYSKYKSKKHHKQFIISMMQAKIIALDPSKISTEYISEAMVAWTEKRGTALKYIQPGKPQQNAYVERFNRTVRYDLLAQHLFDDLEQMQEPATDWMWIYNHQRPNVAIGGITPKMKLAMAA